MSKPKRERRSKSVSKKKKREPLEVVVSFSAPDPSDLALPNAKVADASAKKADDQERPPVIFRF